MNTKATDSGTFERLSRRVPYYQSSFRPLDNYRKTFISKPTTPDLESLSGSDSPTSRATLREFENSRDDLFEELES